MARARIRRLPEDKPELRSMPAESVAVAVMHLPITTESGRVTLKLATQSAPVVT